MVTLTVSEATYEHQTFSLVTPKHQDGKKKTGILERTNQTEND